MSGNAEGLSAPLHLRLPASILSDIERIAAGSDRTRSWVIVRALRLYLAAGAEGGDCLAILRGREEIAQGGGHDLDDVISELEAIVAGTDEESLRRMPVAEEPMAEFETHAPARHIVKVGLAAIEDGRLLLVRKRGSSVHILPGGKPEAEEDDLAALRREIDEELGCQVAPGVAFLGEFTDRVAGEAATVVTVRLYAGALEGEPRPRSEIEALHWFSPHDAESIDLAPSLTNQIVPFLSDRLA